MGVAVLVRVDGICHPSVKEHVNVFVSTVRVFSSLAGSGLSWAVKAFRVVLFVRIFPFGWIIRHVTAMVGDRTGLKRRLLPITIR